MKSLIHDIKEVVARIITKNDLKKTQTLLEGENNLNYKEDLFSIAFFSGCFLSFFLSSLLFIFIDCYKLALHFASDE